MTKPAVVLIHGMGQHTKDSFEKEFYDGLTAAFSLYTRLRNKDPKDYCTTIGVDYNKIFDEYRAKRKTDVQSYGTLAGTLANSGLTKKVLEAIARLDTFVGSDHFLATHLMDVVLYRYTELAEPVRLLVGKAISDAVASYHSSNVHIVAHSLGTAVAHDTLATIYRPRSVTVPNPLPFDHLSPISQTITGLHMIANTSQVLESFIKVMESIVKPGKEGCLYGYYEYRHVLDPITWVDPFEPTDNGGWVSESDFNRKYKFVRTTSITSEHGNTHSLAHYLFNPLVHSQLFENILGVRLSATEFEDGRLMYRDQTLEGVANKLQTALSKTSIERRKSLSNLFKAFEALKAFVETLGGTYKF